MLNEIKIINDFMPVHVRFYHQRSLYRFVNKTNTSVFQRFLDFSLVENGLWYCDYTMKMIIFLVISAVRTSPAGLVGLLLSFLREGWVGQTVCTCLPVFRSWHPPKGHWLSLKYGSRLQGDKPVNSASKLFYPKSLRVKEKRKRS